jgi:hypothetical protein
MLIGFGSAGYLRHRSGIGVAIGSVSSCVCVHAPISCSLGHQLTHPLLTWRGVQLSYLNGVILAISPTLLYSVSSLLFLLYPYIWPSYCAHHSACVCNKCIKASSSTVYLWFLVVTIASPALLLLPPPPTHYHY